MTKNIPDGDQLFTGLTKISYDPVEESTIDSVTPIAETPSTADYFRTIKEEVDAALATAPNGPNCALRWHSRCCTIMDSSTDK